MPGFRQKQEWAKAADRSRSPAGPRGGNSLRGWLQKWAWGQDSARGVVDNAHNWVSDHHGEAVDPRIVRLARAHCNPGNAERVVENILPLQGTCPPVQIPGSLIEWILPPYGMFHWLRNTSPGRFKTHLGAKEGGVADWWNQFFASTKGKQFKSLHPWLQGRSPEQLKFHLPLMIFDDAGPFSNTCSTFARTWYSLLGLGAEKETRFLIGSGLKDGGVPDLSWDPIMESFQRLAEPVEEGTWGGVLLFLGADLEYACNVVGLPHFNSRQNCCTDCMANMHDVPHNDFSTTAAWRATLKDRAQYMGSLRVPLHPLAAHPWFNHMTYRFDLLHMVDHHGIANHIIGNILWHHVSQAGSSDALPGGTTQERLDFLNADIVAFYQERHVADRVPRLHLSNIKDDFPELKGNGIKAANTRGLVPYVTGLQQRATTLNPDRKSRHMRKVVESLQECMNIWYGNSYFLGASELDALKRHLTKVGQHYQVLQSSSMAAEETMWKPVVKMHYVVAHLASQSELINPRFVQGYRSESMVGRICEIYSHSNRGLYREVVQRVSLLKYRTGMVFLWA